MNRLPLTLFSLFLGVFAVVSTVQAQDPRGSAARASALKWLSLVDRDDAKASWDAATVHFKEEIPIVQWTTVLRQTRLNYGAVGTRTLVDTKLLKSFANLPPGEYAMLVFRSSYAKKTVTHESLSMSLDKDGVWRVLGYVID